MRAKYGALGTIAVEVWRSADVGPSDGCEIKKPELEDEVPEKALHGRALSLATRYIEALETGIWAQLLQS